MSTEPTQEEINQKEWEDPANWRGGIFYYGPKDTRPWVPKRSMFGRRRFGGTPNFAIRSARQTIMVVVGICVLIVFAVSLLEKSGWLP